MSAMRLGWDVLTATDWRRLSHAHGPAIDTPGHLCRLFEDDEDRWAEAIDHLNGAVIHQSSVYPATAPAALVVAGLLGDPRLARPLSRARDDRRSIRAMLLGFLVEVAEGAEPDRTLEELLDAYRAPDDDSTDPSSGDPERRAAFEAIIACRNIAPALLDPVLGCLRDEDLRVRVDAADTATALSRVPTLESRRGEIIERLEWIARIGGEYFERACVLRELGALGAVDRTFLDDPHPGIRLCAAIAENLSDDPDATREIMTALLDPVPGWYPVPNLLVLYNPQNILVHQAIRRTKSFDELLPVAVRVAGDATVESGDSDWGTLLVAAFPEPVTNVGSLTSAQRAYLHALIANDDIWRPAPPPMTPETVWGPDKLFARVGLPRDRDFLRIIAGPPET
jgi:hypothetical protein